MRGVPRPASLVVHAAWVAVEAAEVQLLLGWLLAGGQVLASPAAHELLSSQLLLLLGAQLALELTPWRQAERRQGLPIPAATNIPTLQEER